MSPEMFALHPSCANVVIVNAEDGVVQCDPPRSKVALCGFATNTLGLAPWTDPEFEIWGLNQAYSQMPRRADRWFEIHQREYTEDARDPEYLKVLSGIGIPVYMIEIFADVPTSVRFPIERAIKFAGRDYFTSTIAYMLCLAMMEGFKEIHLYGINLAIGEEYYYQKACAEYFIGKAEGMGIKIYVPHASSMLKQHGRYGYAAEPVPGMLTRQLLQNRIGAYQAEIEQLQAACNQKIGMLKESQALVQAIEGAQHGADIVLAKPASLGPTS